MAMDPSSMMHCATHEFHLHDDQTSMIPVANCSFGGSCMPIVFQKDGSYLVGALDCWTKTNPATFVN